MSLRRSLALGASCLGLAGLLLGSQVATGEPQAQTTPAVPEPSPTEAGVSADKRYTVVGSARTVPGVTPPSVSEGPRQAALLNAYRQLVSMGAEISGVLPDEKVGGRTGYQFFEMNADHPQHSLMSWVMRAAAEDSEATGPKNVNVNLVSPPLSELNSDFPQFMRTIPIEVDGSGPMEMVGAGYDGRIHVLRHTPRGYDSLGTSPCLSSYTHVTYTVPGGKEPNWEQVRLTRLHSIRSVEVPGPGKVRVVAELRSSEEVAGQFLGQATEEREVLIRINEPGVEPTLELQEPNDFLQTEATSVSLRGLLKAPEGLSSARLRYNGRPFWQTPEGLSSKKLKMDIIVPLLPGWNSAQLQIVDSARRLISRELLIRREAPPPLIQPGRRRALLIGIGGYESSNYESIPSAEADIENVKRFIMGPQNGAGFALQNVVSLKGQQASREAILNALRQLRVEQSSPTAQDRTFTLVYFAGLTVKSGGSGGKALLPWDAKGVDEGALRAKDIIEALGPLGNQDVLLVLDTAHSKLSGLKYAASWLDSQDFCQHLEQQGWAVLASGDVPPEERGGAEGGRFTKLLLGSLAGSGDSDNDGLVEFDELYRNLFDSWMAQGPGSQAPLRRGNLLGRTPVVSVRR